MTIATLYAGAKSRLALRQAAHQLRAINAFESEVAALSDADLRAAFQALRGEPPAARIARGFAIAREAARRALGMRPYDVQILGGLVLHAGKLAEMRTGEGKTLALVAPAALLALKDEGVHVVTANSYLAGRDAERMRPVYEFLGLSVAAISEEMPVAERQAAYLADVTYGVGHEFGFDFLKDNLVSAPEQRVQRGLAHAIVDEVDSVLIDEARVPLLIAAPGPDVSETVRTLQRAMGELLLGEDVTLDLKERTAVLTNSGYEKVEQALVEFGVVASAQALYHPSNLPLVRRLHSAVKAHCLFRRDRDYVVESGELVLVDQGTGRKMYGRRFEDGLHEALEAKEGLPIQPGTITRASITYQNFFGQYGHLAGLSGTAMTDADEFAEIYGLETVAIPTHRPVIRIEHRDTVFATKAAKFTAVAQEVARRHAAGQPVLVGCATVRDAEVVSRLLAAKGLSHEVLSAKHLEREAAIIARAGEPGAITVATNMAGRGTDIALGGERPTLAQFEAETATLQEAQAAHAAALAAWETRRAEVAGKGGLFVLATERNGLRRVDNQLAGRSGRQGEPGEVAFMLSLEDELLSVFAANGKLRLVRNLIDRAGQALSGKAIASLVTAAQQRVETLGFEARKNLMKYDDVIGQQRAVLYAQRQRLLEDDARLVCREAVETGMAVFAETAVPQYLDEAFFDQAALKRQLAEDFGLKAPVLGWVRKAEDDSAKVREALVAFALERFDALELTPETMRAEALAVVDSLWSEHLAAMDELTTGMALRGTGGGNPVFHFHKDAFALFESLQQAIRLTIAARLLDVGTRRAREAAAAAQADAQAATARVVEAVNARWVLRNEACPCGSGRRFKHCHGSFTGRKEPILAPATAA